MAEKVNPVIKNYNNYAFDVGAIFKSNLLGEEEYAVQSFSIAGLNIGSELIQSKTGVLSLRGYKLDTSNNQITLRILVDEKLKVWLSLYNKIQRYLNNNDEKTPEKVEGASSVIVYDNHHNIEFVINMINSKISMLSPITYELGLPQNQVLHVDLTLTFDRIELKDK